MLYGCIVIKMAGLSVVINPSGALPVSVTNIIGRQYRWRGDNNPLWYRCGFTKHYCGQSLGPGFITFYPCDVARPNASNLNFVAVQVVANRVIAPTGSS